MIMATKNYNLEIWCEENKPQLLKEWNYERNDAEPSEYTPVSGKKVWWKCEKGHEWQRPISQRSKQTNGCPYCFNKRLLPGFNDLATWCKINNPELLKEWDYEKNVKVPSEYMPMSGKKVWWRCEKGHEWQAVIGSRTHLGSGCPYCVGNLPIQGETDLETWCKENRPELLKEWDYEKNTFLPSECTSVSGKKAWWKCEKDHEWSAVINTRTIREYNCPYCVGKRAIAGETDLATWCKKNNPELLEEWDYNKNKDIELYTAKTPKKAWWKCKKGHSYLMSVQTKTDRVFSCPYCTGRRVIIGETDFETWCKATIPELIEEWDFDKNLKVPNTFSPHSHIKVWWKCNNNHPFLMSIDKRTSRGQGCPVCKKENM